MKVVSCCIVYFGIILVTLHVVKMSTLAPPLFGAGVRVLLQVAAVLVRRVLGRAEQRKQCPGQMETLERLRGVREQIQDEDDAAFVAEVNMKQMAVVEESSHCEKIKSGLLATSYLNAAEFNFFFKHEHMYSNLTKQI